MSSLTKTDLKEIVRGAVKEELKTEKQNLPTETHIDHVCGCPDCYCGAIEKMNKTSEIACDNCGLPLGNKEFASKISKCPNCGGIETREIEREES